MRLAGLMVLACTISLYAQSSHERVRIVLAGDSTVAEGGGWGLGFAASFDSSEVEVINLARNGRSSKSVRDEGLWNPVHSMEPDYVLIQFGHNDVPGKGPERETDAATAYRDNMARYVDDARAAGAIPILVTSITRRNLTPAGKVEADSLGPYVEEIRRLAAAKKTLLMDLFALTVEQCQNAGPAGCRALGAKLPDGRLDTTHLSSLGQREVGAIAAKEFVRVVLPGQPLANPKTLVASILLPSNRKRTTFPIRNDRGVGANGLWGWGDPAAEFFDRAKINVVNRAISGQSSRTYLTQGHRDSVLALMKPGDFVIMQFGHNDESRSTIFSKGEYNFAA
jgi:lysophospholipase L1-like esterase